MKPAPAVSVLELPRQISPEPEIEATGNGLMVTTYAAEVNESQPEPLLYFTV